MKEREISFVECDSVEEANRLNLNVWRFVGLRENRFVFFKRVKELK